MHLPRSRGALGRADGPGGRPAEGGRALLRPTVGRLEGVPAKGFSPERGRLAGVATGPTTFYTYTGENPLRNIAQKSDILMTLF